MPVRFLLLAAIAWIAPSPVHAQMLHKCTDANGRISYADRPCDAPPTATAPARPAARATERPAGPATAAPLSAASVEEVLRRAIQMVDAGDVEGPCALASPVLRFSIVSRGMGPVERRGGGRAELCAAHREDGALRAQAQIRTRTAIVSRVDVRLNPDGRGAGASYVTESRISQQGTLQLTLRCRRDEVLSLHGNQLLFDSANATCEAT